MDFGLGGEKIETLFPADCTDDVTGVIRRGRRMGLAFTEIEFHSGGRILHLAITAARFEQTRGRPGTVLVVEDTSARLRYARPGPSGDFFAGRTTGSSGSIRARRWKPPGPSRS